jgi:hypothetical protein
MKVSGQLHKLRKNPEYPLNRGLGGSQSQSEPVGEEKNLPLL